MPFFNRRHAMQGFEMLAAVCGLFASLVVVEALASTGAAGGPAALLVIGTAALSASAGIAGGNMFTALRSILVGPFMACVLLAIVVPFSGAPMGAYAENATWLSVAFAAGAATLFLALRALRSD